MTVDVTRAYFQARQWSDTADFEPGNTDVVGRLNLSQNGLQNTQSFWKSFGFKSRLTSPCNFLHKQTERAVLDSARRRFYD